MTPALAAYLDAVQARCDRATPGPWTSHKAKQADNVGGYDYGIADAGQRIIAEAYQRVGFATAPGGYEDRPAEANGRLIAHARTDLPTLVQLVRKLSHELSRVTCSCGPAGSIDATDHDEFCPFREILARADALLPPATE